jgi:hypothetical protein
MLRCSAPLTVSSKKYDHTIPLDNTAHHTVSHDKFTALSTWMFGFSEDQYVQLFQFTVPLSFNLPHQNNQSCPQTLNPRPLLFQTTHRTQICDQDRLQPLHATNSLSTQLFHLAVLRFRCAPALLVPVSPAHRLTDFFGDHVNCCNTITEFSPLVDERGLPDRCLYTSCKARSVANLLQILEIVNRVWGSVANSRFHRLRTSHTLSDFQYHFKIIICVARKEREHPPFWIVLKVLQF